MFNVKTIFRVFLLILIFTNCSK